ncbi:MGMT family protein [Povalibacter sp.]|uniref:MGMT family protein n=1 Tax=Povalibacter sp. TaxID=1962978 RepID=UPI002F42C448
MRGRRDDKQARPKRPRTGSKRVAAKVTRRKQPVALIATDLPARILAAVRRIPRGKVCTYGDVADVAGLPRRARLVGTVLRQTPASRDLPWFRVINAGGRISFPVGSDAYQRQRSKLETEGVVFVGGRVDLKHYGWPPREEQLDELLWRMDR